MNTIIGVILVIIGVFNFFFPKQSLLLEGGFLFKNLTPSPLTLQTRKIIGGISAVFGVILIFT